MTRSELRETALNAVIYWPPAPDYGPCSHDESLRAYLDLPYERTPDLANASQHDLHVELEHIMSKCGKRHSATASDVIRLHDIGYEFAQRRRDAEAHWRANGPKPTQESEPIADEQLTLF